MDTSSSDEFSSDNELDEIIDSAWSKTKYSLHLSEDDDEDSVQNNTVSQVFVLDRTSQDSKQTSNRKELSENDNVTDESDDGDQQNEDEEESSSLFVVDKKPSSLDVNMTALTDMTDNDDFTSSKIDKRLEKEQNNKKKQRRRKRDRFKRIELSSSLEVKMDPTDIYINTHSKYATQPSQKNPIERISKGVDEIMKKSVLTADIEKKEAVPVNQDDTRHNKKVRRKEREKSKGKGWFDMPAGDISSEDRKNDVLALKMRRALDPKRFYKGDDIKGLPKYFQFGTVVEDASEFYSARIPKKQRKKSMVEELMADAEFRKFNKRKFSEIQDLKAKGLGPYQGFRPMKMKKKKK